MSPVKGLTVDDRLVLKIEGATPDTIDAQAALRLATSYLDLVLALAEDEGTVLHFTGIEVLNQSVGLAFRASAPDAAQEVAKRATRCVNDEEQPPRGAASATRAVKDAVRHLPGGQKARVLVGPWTRELAVGTAAEELPAESSLSVRATLIRAGGTRPAARFDSRSEARPFTLYLSMELAREIGRFLYRDLDIVARVHRDREGAIEYGELLEFNPVGDDDASAGWRDWYRSYASEWDEVKDIEAELARHRD